MCISAILAGLGSLGTAGSVGLGLAGGMAASKLLGAKPKASALADPAAERAAAETAAAQSANSKLAQKNRSRAVSSLLADGGLNTATGGKTLLGQ